ncbi:MAG TPA: hypothetical protein PLI18_16155, partial [Pirellulaceae bacterium]|nr:hypothetical protein [Pirellulaceae bacterium]
PFGKAGAAEPPARGFAGFSGAAPPGKVVAPAPTCGQRGTDATSTGVVPGAVGEGPTFGEPFGKPLGIIGAG